MPPKPKFTKQEIVNAALELASEKGLEALTSRDLGARLGSSARPIFTVFRSMDEVQKEVRAAAMRRFEAYAADGHGEMPEFKRFGMRMVGFAIEEPRLYRMLFMTENGAMRGFDDIFEDLGRVAPASMEILQGEGYGLSEREAWFLFRHMWIYTFGVGALCVTGVCRFTEQEISGMLSQAFAANMLLVKSGKMDECRNPEKVGYGGSGYAEN